ncbi:MAG: M15 family metallopeptidase [Lachnospiraceae bacterium]|nr:M15 family metallopeptidase [Lachnospiraceae bacterium]
MKKYIRSVSSALFLGILLTLGMNRMEVYATEPIPVADPNVVTEVPVQQPTVPAARPKRKEDILTVQVKADIESMLKEDTQDAIMNGYLSLLNKDYILHDELEMDLVGIGNGHQLEPLAAEKITQLVKDAQKERLYINITSSYRTYLKQVELFKNKIERLEKEGYTHEEAVKEAATVVAVPGTSEHHLGLTVDFVTGRYKKLDEGIRNTNEYKWVEEHAWEYGYIIRYPQGKSDITGIITEPWHLRYVGIPAAKLIHDRGICLEEFLGVAYDDQKDGVSYGAGWINTGR